MNMKPEAYALLQKVRRESPVVHHLTNWVTIYDCAQVGKTLGASPVMAVNPFSSKRFIDHGGRIPAPLTSMRN